jgi:general secretion pathway protein L
MTVLSIYVPEEYAEGEGEPIFNWVLRRANNFAARSGTSSVLSLPKAEQCEIVVPASVVMLTEVSLPRTSRQRLRQMLPFAVEDKLLSDPETVHVAAGARQPNGTMPVAVIEKSWLHGVLSTLGKVGLRPQRVVAETCLPEVEPGTWTVVWNGGGGFARTGSASGMALDGALGPAPPFALSRAIEEATAQGAAPVRIVVRPTSPSAGLPKLEAWSAELGIQVAVGRPWAWSSQEGTAGEINLLQGEFAATSGVSEWLHWLKPVLLLAASIVALQVMAATMEWWLLHREERQLRTAMDNAFRTAFPEAKVIVDAPLQMKRNLADLKRLSGQSEANDFLPLLGHAAPFLKPAGGRVERIQYDKGSLTIDLVVPEASVAESIKTSLQTPGIEARADILNPKPGGVEARMSIGPAKP